MPDITFGPGFYEREDYGSPPRELQNLYAEASPNMPDRQFILIRTEGLDAYKDLSGTLTRGVATSPDQFNNDLFVVYDNQFKRITTAGTVGANITITQPVGENGNNIASDNSPVDFAFSAKNASVGVTSSEMAFTSAGEVYIYTDDGATAALYHLETHDTDITDLNFVNVVYLAGRFVFIPNDDDQFWWSETLDGANIDALNFATAERKGSNLRAGTEFRGDLWLFEKDNIEIWSPTGRADLPFQLRPGGIIDKGIIGPWAHTRVGQSLFWVGDDRVVYRAEGASAVPISTPAISEHLQGISEGSREKITAFSYVQDGHQFVVFNFGVPNAEVAAFVFDTTTNEWHERISNATLVGGGNTPGYVPWCHAWWNGNHYFGSRYDAAIYRLNKAVYGEESVDGLTTYDVTCKATIFAPTRNYEPCYNFTIDCQVGEAGGDSSAARIELKWSDNLGRSYNTGRNLSLDGTKGYSTRVTTAALGRMSPPGRVFQITFSDQYKFAIFGARYNEGNP